MLRAHYKLKEAEFFYGKLQQLSGTDQWEEFAYYTSALVTAARSIGLALQKDLRSEYGEDFDDWWDRQKEMVPDEPLPFGDLRAARNEHLKEGKSVALVTKVADPPAPFTSIFAEYETGTGDMHVCVTTESFEDVEELHRRDGESSDEYLDRATQGAWEIMTEGIQKVNAREDMDLEIIGYSVSDKSRLSETTSSQPTISEYDISKLLSYNQLMDGIDLHLTAMREIVEEAETRFRKY